MRSRTAESDVVVGFSCDVKALRLVEDRGVAVGGGIPDHDLVACVEGVGDLALRIGQRHAVAGHRAAKMDHRAGVPQDLLDRGGRHVVVVRQQAVALLGVRTENEQPMGQRIAGGLVARADQQDEELRQLLGCQILLVGRDQLADHVVTRIGDAVLGDSLEQLDELLTDLGDRGPNARDCLVGYVLGV